MQGYIYILAQLATATFPLEIDPCVNRSNPRSGSAQLQKPWLVGKKIVSSEELDGIKIPSEADGWVDWRMSYPLPIW